MSRFIAVKEVVINPKDVYRFKNEFTSNDDKRGIIDFKHLCEIIAEMVRKNEEASTFCKDKKEHTCRSRRPYKLNFDNYYVRKAYEKAVNKQTSQKKIPLYDGVIFSSKSGESSSKIINIRHFNKTADTAVKKMPVIDAAIAEVKRAEKARKMAERKLLNTINKLTGDERIKSLIIDALYGENNDIKVKSA